MPDAVARKTQLDIGGVSAKTDVQRVRIVVDVRAPELEQRPHERAAPHAHARESARARATQDAKQHGLDLIVRVMRSKQPACVATSPHAVQKAVTGAARMRFRSESLLGAAD